uniref:Uncharacterized protein n=1 Tax=Engystomops pustulosus TaxID=76066 RepID=A0AAV6YGS1_ENGPU|nr:hypothetical protein GDO81_018490 [Engystomops pustulosus]
MTSIRANISSSGQLHLSWWSSRLERLVFMEKMEMRRCLSLELEDRGDPLRQTHGGSPRFSYEELPAQRRVLQDTSPSMFPGGSSSSSSFQCHFYLLLIGVT